MGVQVVLRKKVVYFLPRNFIFLASLPLYKKQMLCVSLTYD